MKSIRDLKGADERRKRSVRVLSFILLGIMILSSAGYALFSRESESGENSGNDGQTASGMWYRNIGGQEHYFSFSVSDVKNISVNIISDIKSLSGQDIYINSDNEAASYEISSNLARYAKRMQTACYGNCSDNLPERDCRSNLIVVNSSAIYEKVYQKDNCIFIEGNLRAVDAFLYKILE